MIPEERGWWDQLGVDEAVMPVHLPMGVTETGQGPENDSAAHHWVCWCGDVECPLALALQHAWASGRRKGHQDAETTMTWMTNDPGWEGQSPSMGYAATFSQELTERPGYARRQLTQQHMSDWAEGKHTHPGEVDDDDVDGPQ